MKEISQDVLTVAVFNKLLAEAFIQFRVDFSAEVRGYVNEKIDALDQKMMSGFEMVFDRFDKIESRIDDIAISKADSKNFLALHKRVLRLEEKVL